VAINTEDFVTVIRIDKFRGQGRMVWRAKIDSHGAPGGEDKFRTDKTFIPDMADVEHSHCPEAVKGLQAVKLEGDDVVNHRKV
jgi:hypothetical protein